MLQGLDYGDFYMFVLFEFSQYHPKWHLIGKIKNKSFIGPIDIRISRYNNTA